MNPISLLPFQVRASEQIAARFNELNTDAKRPWEHGSWKVPYYQALSSITGSGKTPILADAVATIRASLPSEPIVLWISKAKAVVDQTRTNFEPGGKYSHFLEGFMVCALSGLKADVIRDVTTPVIALATAATFNQKDKQDGTLRVHKVGEDTAADSLWTQLKDRPAAGGRRPLVIVYDEAHNLSDQQADLLLELEPDAILVASATMKTPGRLGKTITRLKDYGWGEEKLVTSASSVEAVRAGLVKRQIILAGYDSLMESAIDEMLEAMAGVRSKAEALSAGFSPKAIYVCKTNISQDDGTPDNPSRPFTQRSAPPILIWRYLVEKKGIDPSDIAVYCDLKFNRKDNPPPADFVHFSGGEEDFEVFRVGNYHHIIFNKNLQEGWDDPECCFAYIDKSMEAKVSAEQVIGRVLRQPGARHYPDPDLNTANFYIRIGNKQEFPQILEGVRKRIAADYPEVKLEGYADRKERESVRKEPKSTAALPQIHIDLEEAITFTGSKPGGPFIDAINKIPDYRKDDVNTVGKGERLRAIQTIGDGSKSPIESAEMHHSNRVMARWIVRRTVQSLYPPAAMSIDWSEGRLDARVEITSIAAQTLRTTAEDVVKVYLEHAALAFEEVNPYTIGAVVVNPKKYEPFTNAVHEGYSDLNPLELLFAKAIDETGNRWARNPANGGYSIPLLEIGDNRRFFPDFLVWKDGIVFALDPKGDHLIGVDAGRKILDIRDENSKQKVVVRLFTEGKWTDTDTKVSSEGYTMWAIKSGQVKPRHFQTIEKAVEAALKT